MHGARNKGPWDHVGMAQSIRATVIEDPAFTLILGCLAETICIVAFIPFGCRDLFVVV